MVVEVGAVLVGATAAAALAAVLPAALARVPDPPPYEDDDEADVGIGAAAPDAPTYPTFGELAAAPALPFGLAVVAALAGGLLGAHTGWAWPLAWLVVLAGVGTLLSWVDLRTYLLPTRIIYPTYAVVALLMATAWLVEGDGAPVRRAAVGLAVALFCYWLPWRINASWMGFGDVRLSGLLGAVLGWAGWAELALGLYLPFLLGGVVGGLLMLLRVLGRSSYPLGPFMFLGTLLGLLLGPSVLPGLAA
ncbi:prepilin peptidase [Nocardioides sp. ChNu-153]|uniref:prepilin peptidase n=1 Tax=unclassified Nocardioides TaxID=2615069 RepID=UPI0024075C29|nr:MULTISPECIES: A24 family peptidase [unclassified Nocardioides]MDF9717687.1 A24 family peptidase [Nocardioides sp. ChNu-99]MDN7121231.1 prepilin peptidase [Nocardioides sp. ChNu-153]